MHEIFEAFQDRNVEFIFDGMKSRRISIPEPQTWTSFVLRNVPQTAPISFCEMVKKLFQQVYFNFICLPELPCGLEHVCGSGSRNTFPLLMIP